MLDKLRYHKQSIPGAMLCTTLLCFLFQRNTKEMLENVSKLTLYSYNFKEGALASAFNSTQPERREVQTADCSESRRRMEVGMLAQEVESILPDAVHTVESLLDKSAH